MERTDGTQPIPKQHRRVQHTPSYARLIDLFPHLEHSGAAPTRDEHQSLSFSKISYEDKRKALREEVADLKVRLKQAEGELEHIQEQIDAHSNLVSPLRRIPPELLRGIFAAAAPSILLGLRDMTLAAPWTLLRVCRHWHDVCLMYGSLWSSINIEAGLIVEGFGPELPASVNEPLQYVHQIPDGNEGAILARKFPSSSLKPRACELLELQLRRSRNADLSIFIQAAHRQDYAQPFLRTLMPHMHRCVQISAPVHILAGTPFPSGFDRLTRAWVDTVTSPAADLWPLDADETQALQNTEQTEMMLALPTLREISILHTFTRERPYRWHRPELLVNLSLLLPNLYEHNCGLAEELYHYLSLCVNLTELTLSDHPGGLPEDSNAVAAVSRTLLPKVRKLDVRSWQATNDLDLLRRLELPQLRSLFLVVPGTLRLKAVVELLAQSSTKLQHLRLHADSFPWEGIKQLFLDEAHLWVALAELHIQSYSWKSPSARFKVPTSLTNAAEAAVKNDNILRLLTRRRVDNKNSVHSDDVFPNLSHLELRLIAPSTEQVVNMLESRRLGAMRLATCRLADTISEHCRHTQSHIHQQHRRLVVQSMLSGECDQFRPWSLLDANDITPHTDGVTRDSWGGGRGPHSLYNPRVWWAQGVEREPVQLERLKKLEDEGLELYMKRSDAGAYGDN